MLIKLKLLQLTDCYMYYIYYLYWFFVSMIYIFFNLIFILIRELFNVETGNLFIIEYIHNRIFFFVIKQSINLSSIS